jgi:hypothetical protein
MPVGPQIAANARSTESRFGESSSAGPGNPRRSFECRGLEKTTGWERFRSLGSLRTIELHWAPQPNRRATRVTEDDSEAARIVWHASQNDMASMPLRPIFRGQYYRGGCSAAFHVRG